MHFDHLPMFPGAFGPGAGGVEVHVNFMLFSCVVYSTLSVQLKNCFLLVLSPLVHLTIVWKWPRGSVVG